MKKRDAVPDVPTARHLEGFRRALESYQRKPIIATILQDQALVNRCATLLWQCVNGSSARLDATSRDWCKYWNAEFVDAIRGVEAVINIYTKLVPRPEKTKALRKICSDLRNRHETLTPLPSKIRGREEDWTLLLRVREDLESLLGKPPSYSALAALLNATFAAAGQQKEYSAEGVQRALKRVQHRLVQ